MALSANPPHLPEPNADEVDAFWDRYLAAAGLPDDTPFDDVGSFGDTVWRWPTSSSNWC
ncbi:MAG: hypothetical protein R2710_01310 [Acidimicrobiales bacterium]